MKELGRKEIEEVDFGTYDDSDLPDGPCTVLGYPKIRRLGDQVWLETRPANLPHNDLSNSHLRMVLDDDEVEKLHHDLGLLLRAISYERGAAEGIEKYLGVYDG